MDDVATSLEDMADNGLPPEDPQEGGEGGGDDAPVMRSGDGGGDDIDPSEVRPLIAASTAKPLPEHVATRLGAVLDHPLEHVMLHIDGKAASASSSLPPVAWRRQTRLACARRPSLGSRPSKRSTRGPVPLRHGHRGEC